MSLLFISNAYCYVTLQNLATPSKPPCPDMNQSPHCSPDDDIAAWPHTRQVITVIYLDTQEH